MALSVMASSVTVLSMALLPFAESGAAPDIGFPGNDPRVAGPTRGVAGRD